MSFWKKLLGDPEASEIKRLQKTVVEIEAHEEEMSALSDHDMREMTETFRTRLQTGETMEDILPEAFALVCEAAWRTLGMKPYPVQLLGGIVLHEGRIAEMKTGEGKTLVATLPAYLNALTGKGVHIVTVNDYLARRDSEWMGKVHRFLGLSVGIIVHDMDAAERQRAYAADITYGTNNEFGFDYLRDNMVIYKNEMVQRPLQFAIVDEVDSILIDEARTPLIISGAGEQSTELYERADRFASRLRLEEDFVLDEKKKTINLTEEGVRRTETHFRVDNLTDMENTTLSHHVNQALRANFLMRRDKDYVVQNGEVIIVDEFTGRLMMGRRYSDGLHQAIEAKEHVKVARESKTLATITFQNYFRMYKKLSGMTGTAKTEEAEFQGIYNLDVISVPTHKAMIRLDHNDVVYRTEKGKYAAVVEEVIRCHEAGQPVLVGTVTVEKSEVISKLLQRRGIAHEVLNAKFHEKEAEIVAQAGKLGQVTIATNMAGRGTDILLGGNPEFLARREMRRQEIEAHLIEEATGHNETDDEALLAARALYKSLYARFKKETDEEHEQVVAAGGLHIIGTERHESRRIDNQLRGRSGRQGDPGSSRFFIALDDDLMRLFGSDRIIPMVERLGLDEDTPIDFQMLSKQIEAAQKRIEGNHYDMRKQVLQYDDVMNKQREVIYSQRRRVLEGDSLRDSIVALLRDLVNAAVETYIAPPGHPEQWDVAGMLEYAERIFLPKGALAYTDDEIDIMSAEQFAQALMEEGEKAYAAREAAITEHGFDMREIERVVLLRVVDSKWMDHIDAMDQLRQGVGLRAYGHHDPVAEYKIEGHAMFEEMIHAIREETLTMLFHLNVEKKQAPVRERTAEPVAALHGETGVRAAKKPAASAKAVGRNDPCPCGSGKKYKNCCGA